ncbi:MAG: PKD domain-containing protein, partial [Bacteroidota bacterium]
MIRGYLLLLPFALLVSFSTLQAQVSANFTANVTSGCGSLQVSFTDQSSSTAGSINSWSWNLGGVNSTNQNPGRIFGSPGQFTICLTVTDNENNSDTECKTNYIQVYALPQPAFSVQDQTGCVPFDVRFFDETIPGDANITEWIWGLGGSSGVIINNGSIPIISSTYNNPDDYTISLTVTDQNGCIGTITQTDFITVAPDPVVEVTVDNGFGCSPPFTANFSHIGSTQGMVYLWDFGNGSTFTGTNPPPITYNQPGIYTVEVIGTNVQSGCRDTFVLEDAVQVGNEIDFTVNRQEGCEDLIVILSDQSPEPADSIVWDMGDGTLLDNGQLSHTYTDPGCYTIILTRYINGCASVLPIDNCIRVFGEPTGTMMNDRPLGCSLPHLVSFTSQSPTAVGYLWDFGDGFTSSNPNPVHSFQAFGTYPIKLTFTSPEGCETTISTDTIVIQPLNANIAFDEFLGCTPLDITLNDQSASIVPINSWEWELTNNSSSPPSIVTAAGPTPSLTLVDTGAYTIRLIVSNTLGCVDTGYFNNRVGVGMPPVVDFDADPQITCISSAVTFNDHSSENADEWFWEFGDGGFSGEQNPTFQYVDTGYFNVALTAFHRGCSNRMSVDSFVYVNPPKSGFSIEQFCDNRYTVNLYSGAIGADSVFYDFGDLTTED